MRKKLLAFIMSAVMAVTAFAFAPKDNDFIKVEVAEAAYSSDYRNWSQGGSQYQGMVDVGCLIVAQAKMLYEANINREAGFNPDWWYNWLLNNGYIASSNDLNMRDHAAPVYYASSLGKNMEYLGIMGAGDAQIWDNINAGYYTILDVGGHYVLIANELSKSNGVLYCYDSWYTTGSVNPQPITRYVTHNRSIVYKADEPEEDLSYIGHAMTEEEAGGRTIPDGNYWIFNELTAWYYLNCPGDSPISVNGTELGMMNDNSMPGKYDVWNITYQNNGFYTIKQYGTNMCLSANGGKIFRGEDIILWAEKGNAKSQQWSIKNTNHGFTLQAMSSSFFLTVDGSRIENGTKLYTYNETNYKGQSFCFIPYGTDKDKLFENGTYKIKTVCGDDYYVGIYGDKSEYKGGSEVVIRKNSTDEFEFKYAGDGYYKIYEKSSGLALQVLDSEAQKSYTGLVCDVVLAEEQDFRRQQWFIEKTPDGFYRLVSKLNGHSLNLSNGECTNGNNVLASIRVNNNKQKWLIEKVEESTQPTVTTTTAVTTTITNSNSISTSIADNTALAGDTNGNGTVNAADLVMLQLYLTKKDVLTNSANADMNLDSKINVFDAVLLRRKILNMSKNDFFIE